MKMLQMLRTWTGAAGRSTALVAREQAALLGARVRRAGPDDRGDVPGWVLVTMMTAGLVIILWATAGDLLNSVFVDAVKGVKGP